MDKVYAFAVAHWAAILFILGYFFTALVATMPEPGDPRPVSVKVYEWIFNFLHLVSNKVVQKYPKIAPVKES